MGIFYLIGQIMDYDLSKLVNNPTAKIAQADLTNYYKNKNSPIDYYNSAVESLGIPDVRAGVAADRKAIDDTQTLIDAVDPSVTGRTSGSLVTEAQRQGLVTKEKTPLLGSLGKLGGIYGTSSANLSDLMGQASMQGQLGYQGQTDTMAALMQRLDYARYQEEQQRQANAANAQNAWIEALMKNIQAGFDSLIDEANADADRAGDIYDAGWAALNSPLRVTSNTGQQGNTYNPQSTYNVQPTGNYSPKTYNPQKTSGKLTKSTGKLSVSPSTGYGGTLKVSDKPSGGTVRVVEPKRPKGQLRVVY